MEVDTAKVQEIRDPGPSAPNKKAKTASETYTMV
jgi:hypothetical protein